LERIVNDRASHQGTVLAASAADRREQELLDIEVTTTLDKLPTPVRRYMRALASLPTKLYWAFRLMGPETTAAKAAKATVLYAIKRHASLIETALTQAQVQQTDRLAKRIKAVLRQKGPCSAREIQRSLYQAKRADIDSGLEYLLTTGQVVFAQAKREYHIPGAVDADESSSAPNRNAALSRTVHG
jgi:hypothetical protein